MNLFVLLLHCLIYLYNMHAIIVVVKIDFKPFPLDAGIQLHVGY